jgi:hypothetical protein
MNMTEKENFLKVIRGETPAWVPRWYGGVDPYGTKPPSCITVAPGFIRAKRTPEGGEDIFGVKYIATADTGGQSLPVPGQFMLDDIRKWRDVIKVPDISGFNWETLCKEDLENSKIDRNQSALIMGTHVGYFQHLMNFMGFTEGLCAMSEEPEAVKELYEYLSDFYVEVATKAIDQYKPDLMGITDDTAAAINPFISVKMFQELVKPYHARLGKIAMDRGIPVVMHNCGRCEDFIPDWIEYGVKAWNPAQLTNDLDGIKKKYGNSMVLIGCWDSSGPAGWNTATEELVRSKVRETIDRFAPGGGFMFYGSTYGPKGDESLANRRKWMTSEYEAYRETPYK